MSTLLCGFYPVLHAVLYIFLQIAGAICGSLLVAGLLPDTSIAMGPYKVRIAFRCSLRLVCVRPALLLSRAAFLLAGFCGMGTLCVLS